MSVRRIAVLGGTTEGLELARLLSAKPDHQVLYSLAGVTAAPGPVPAVVRRGGFGGVAGLTHYLTEHRVDALVDATHPFAATMSAHAERACTELAMPRVQIRRPAWTPGPGDAWHEVSSMAEAVAAVAARGARRIFLSIGGRECEGFLAIAGRWYLIRAIEQPRSVRAPHAGRVEVVLDRGPFSFEDEVALLRTHCIELLVSKNSGGCATYPKLLAARHLGIPAILIARPPPAPGPVVTSALAAAEWLAAR